MTEKENSLDQIRLSNLLDFSNSLAGDEISKFINAYDVIPHIKEIVLTVIEKLDKDQYNEISENVFVHKNAKVAPTAFLGSPCVIGAGTEVRHCAYIRGGALVGENCVIGNSVELKNVIIFDGAQVPHYNYVGDSILGYKSHMGAGSITSNLKSDKSEVTLKIGNEKISTGLRKFGAVLGDYVEVGCNSVLNPGTVIGRNSNIYPLTSVRGVIPEKHIVKSMDKIIAKFN